MKTLATLFVGLFVGTASVYFWTADEKGSVMAAEKDKGPLLVHNVYFSLNESTPETREKLVASCHKYLSGHQGVVFYAAGTLSDLDRPVNDREFDVALHFVFKQKADHDRYQEAPMHLQFIEENKDNWSKVWVFDSVVEQ